MDLIEQQIDEIRAARHGRPLYGFATVVGGIIVAMVRIWQAPSTYRKPTDPGTSEDPNPQYDPAVIEVTDHPLFDGTSTSMMGRDARTL